MARFVFAAWPIPGSLFPSLAVARAVAARGHEVAVYTGARSRNLVLGEGFTHCPFDPSLDQLVDSLLLSPNGISKHWRYPWRRLPMMRQFVLDPVPQQVSDLEAVLASWHPDVIVCEPAMWAPYLVLHEAHRIPVAVLEYSFCTLPGPDSPPMGLRLPAPTNRYTRLVSHTGIRLFNLALAGGRRAASAMRHRYGLAPLNGSVVELMYRLPLVMVPSCPEFDYNRQDLPPTVQYVGACLWYPTQEPSPWLASVPSNQPWVHATEGTLYAQRPKMLRAVAQGLANRGMQVIITTGKQRQAGMIDLGPLATNIVVQQWVSYPDLLPRTDAVVTIGGGGTLMSALAWGVPLVVVPTIWDHPENARRVMDAGVGVQVRPRDITPLRMREAVEQVLNTPSYRENARRIATSLQRLGGSARAAQLLEHVAVHTSLDATPVGQA